MRLAGLMSLSMYGSTALLGDSGITGDKMTEQILDLADNDDSDLAGLVSVDHVRSAGNIVSSGCCHVAHRHV